ncbi:MAG: PAS domain-containing protein [Desulfovibrio sp.]|jgi:PAS domain S-box-containing protein|nr:PAS domain-containing protein [Desulfovibrio sp.]
MKSLSSNFLRKHFERILDAVPDGIFISDAVGVTLRVNRMYEQLTGLTQEKVHGHNVCALVDEGVFDRVLNPEIVSTGKPATHMQTLKADKLPLLSHSPETLRFLPR